MFRLTALDHVGLTVADLDRSLAFYRALGFTVLRASGPNAEGVRSAVIQVGAQELNLFSGPDHSRSDAVSAQADHPIGIDHFGLEVAAASIEDVIAGLRRAGIEIARGPVKRRDGTALFVRDPDGVRVELQLKTPATPEAAIAGAGAPPPEA